MIFSAPRVAVIDDNETHLKAIIDTIQAFGSSCVGMQFKPEEELYGIDTYLLRGVRCLFIDMHLVPGTTLPSSDDTRAFGILAGVLQKIISRDGGPYILLLWTEYRDKIAGLRNYLDSQDAFPPELYYAKPVAVIGIPKSEYIDILTGNIREPGQLKTVIQDALKEVTSFASLLTWEVEVLSAAKDVLVSIVDLVPPNRRHSHEFAQELGVLLSRLACEAVGEPNVATAPRAAIIQALSPFLFDKLTSCESLAGDLWVKLINQHRDEQGTLGSKEAGTINNVFHLSFPEVSSISPVDWGAVIKWPFGDIVEDFEKITGLTFKTLLCEDFKMRSSALLLCEPVLVRVGAACDYAQNHKGPIPYFLGIKIPDEAQVQTDRKEKPIKKVDAIWESPVFYSSISTEKSWRLFVHCRFGFTFLAQECSEWTVQFRIREQLLTQLLFFASHYSSRPGIISMKPE